MRLIEQRGKAGLLMFGKGLSVRERFDNIRMDYIDISNLVLGSRGAIGSPMTVCGRIICVILYGR